MEAKDIKKVACVGAGVIGYSWALYYSLKKLSVNVYDITDEVLNLAKEKIHESLLNLKKNNVVTEEEINEIESRINYTTSMEEAVKDVEFITESGPESYDIKRKMIEEMEKYTKEDTIISSSTSGLLYFFTSQYAKTDSTNSLYPYQCKYTPIFLLLLLITALSPIVILLSIFKIVIFL